MTGDGSATWLAWIDAWAPVDVDQEQDADVELQREQAEAILLGTASTAAVSAGPY
jgi:hypothetical protein